MDPDTKVHAGVIGLVVSPVWLVRPVRLVVESLMYFVGTLLALETGFIMGLLLRDWYKHRP